MNVVYDDDGSLLQMSDLEKKATEQLTDIMANSHDDALLLKGDEWRRMASLWRCIKAGLYVPYLGKKWRGWLLSRPGRIEAERIADRMSGIMSLAQCAELVGAEFQQGER